MAAQIIPCCFNDLFSQVLMTGIGGTLGVSGGYSPPINCYKRMGLIADCVSAAACFLKDPFLVPDFHTSKIDCDVLSLFIQCKPQSHR